MKQKCCKSGKIARDRLLFLIIQSLCAAHSTDGALARGAWWTLHQADTWHSHPSCLLLALVAPVALVAHAAHAAHTAHVVLSDQRQFVFNLALLRREPVCDYVLVFY